VALGCPTCRRRRTVEAEVVPQEGLLEKRLQTDSESEDSSQKTPVNKGFFGVGGGT
jgi:hypothetical protein